MWPRQYAPCSATRRTGRNDCNRDAHTVRRCAWFAALYVTLSIGPPLSCSNEQHDANDQDRSDANRPDDWRIKRDAVDEIGVRDVCVHDVCSGLDDQAQRPPPETPGRMQESLTS